MYFQITILVQVKKIFTIEMDESTDKPPDPSVSLTESPSCSNPPSTLGQTKKRGHPKGSNKQCLEQSQLISLSTRRSSSLPITASEQTPVTPTIPVPGRSRGRPPKDATSTWPVIPKPSPTAIPCVPSGTSSR